MTCCLLGSLLLAQIPALWRPLGDRLRAWWLPLSLFAGLFLVTMGVLALRATDHRMPAWCGSPVAPQTKNRP